VQLAENTNKSREYSDYTQEIDARRSFLAIVAAAMGLVWQQALHTRSWCNGS
jgi:hypothetical protein